MTTPARTAMNEEQHLEQHEFLQRTIPVMQADIAWLVEYFTPDDDGSDRLTRIEGRLTTLESKLDRLIDHFGIGTA